MSLNIKPLSDRVLIEPVAAETKTASGIFIPSQNGKSEGVKPRWGRVWAIGPEQQDVNVGDWIYVEHGRWTRGITVEDENGDEIIIRRVENKSIMMQSDERPNDVYIPKM
jgi:chaperonin GroES